MFVCLLVYENNNKNVKSVLSKVLTYYSVVRVKLAYLSFTLAATALLLYSRVTDLVVCLFFRPSCQLSWA